MGNKKNYLIMAPLLAPNMLRVPPGRAIIFGEFGIISYNYALIHEMNPTMDEQF